MSEKNKHIENSKDFKNLSVNKGVSNPEIINKNAIERFKKNKKKLFDTDSLFQGIISGNITMLSQAITLIESNLDKHQKQAQEIIEKCLAYSGKSIRIGITGVPGVGKSTFLEALGSLLINQNKKIAILAIDPSSEKSKGSILGDKTRMEELVKSEKVFVRPSPSSGSLGGVARKTRESIILCEAAGFDTIFIETVGVGQSETRVHSMVDFFLLLMLAGAGDELQGIKRGIMEMADAIAITKAEGNNKTKSKAAAAEYNSALSLFPANESQWKVKVNTCSAYTKEGILEVWNLIQEYFELTKSNGYFEKKRKEQSLFWLKQSIEEKLLQSFYQSEEITKEIAVIQEKLLQNKISPFSAADYLFALYSKS